MAAQDTLNTIINALIILFVMYVVYKFTKAFEIFKGSWGVSTASELPKVVINEFVDAVVSAPKDIANTVKDVYSSAKGDAKARERLQYKEGYFDYENHIYYGQKVEPGTTKYFETPLGNIAKVTVFDVEKIKQMVSKAGYTSYANMKIAEEYPEAFSKPKDAYLIPYPRKIPKLLIPGGP